MNLGRVIGTVVATRKEQSMDGIKFMLVRHVDPEGKETGSFVVAADAVGAGPDELVLVATGSSARQTVATDKRPCDAVIMAIVDSWDVDGTEKYKK
ncbi:MAG TPA: EutN/CcmL family microcompartment protein [Kiritimatiellia bacterium]|nr:EutN/CcmL family microcompartment protein [Kiritimatiellia bacterium]HRZ13621.1 EutN/CcmL family microcompartment protein [Kiritimatiellia bacterium]HSA19283.1 EutN/CcmL family microcompartment protein [Kiritimatiellia bacterium]